MCLHEMKQTLFTDSRVRERSGRDRNGKSIPAVPLVGWVGGCNSFRRLVLLCVMMLSGVYVLPASTDWTLEVNEENGLFAIRAEIELHGATSKQAWDVLSNYSGLAELIPNMEKSEILEHKSPNQFLIRQVSKEGFLFFRTRVRLVLEVTEVAHSKITFACVGGDFLKHDGSWTIEARDESCFLSFVLNSQPKRGLPPLFRETIVRRATANNLKALVAVILSQGSS